MILSYHNLGEGGRKRVKARITTEHPTSSYGQPVVVLEDGQAVDLLSWSVLGYQVVKATKKEKEFLRKMGLKF